MRISDWSSDVCSSDLIDRLESQRMLLPEVCHNFCGFKFVEDVKRGTAARIIVVALNVLTVCVCDLKAKERWFAGRIVEFEGFKGFGRFFEERLREPFACELEIPR